MKRVLALFLAVMMLVSTPMEILASEVSNSTPVTQTEVEIEVTEESETAVEGESVEGTESVEAESTDGTEESETVETTEEAVDEVESSEENVEFDEVITQTKTTTTEATGITRIQWLQTLTSAFNMTVEEDNYPDNYFSDIDSTYEHYYDVMLATEFGLVDVKAGEAFGPEEPATREFVAHTMNVCMGYVLDEKTYTFSEAATVTYADDIQIAINYGWFFLVDGAFLPEQQVTVAEQEALELIAQTEANDRVIDETHENQYELLEDVIVIPETVTVEMIDIDTYTLLEVLDTFAVGDKIAFLSGDFPVVKKVLSISSTDGVMTITTESVATEDAFSYIDYQGIMDGDLSGTQTYSDNVQMTYVVGGTAENEFEDGTEYDSAEGLKEETISAVKLVQKFAIPKEVAKEFDLAEGVEAQITCTISNPGVDYKLDTVSPYVNFNSTVTFSCNVSMDVLQAINAPSNIQLARVPVGYIGYIEATLELSASGEFTVCLVENVSMGVKWSESKGFQMTKSFKKQAFTIQARVEASVGVRLTAGFDAIALKGNVYAEAGAAASADSTTYVDDLLPTNCTHVMAWMYAEIGCGVELDLIVYDNSWSASYTVYDWSNSPVKVVFHFEDGKNVGECTRDAEKYKYMTPADSKYGYSGDSTGVGSDGEVYAIFEYENITEDTIRITKYNGNHSSLNIPSTLDGYTVTEIGNYAFKNKDRLRLVVIPSSVTFIGYEAFRGCNNLSNIIFSEGLVKIDSYAFKECDSLLSVDFPSTLTDLGYNSFCGCTSLESIDVHKTLENVSTAPFKNCSSLNTVNFEEGITTIPANIFSSCTGLTKIRIPDTVTVIENGAFDSCTNLVSVDLPDGLVEIDYYAFRYCKNLLVADLPSTLTTLGFNAFDGCTALHTVTIPKALTNVSSAGGIFNNCKNLKNVFFEKGITKITDYLFLGSSGITEITIPETITSIGQRAFEDCPDLTNVVLPDGLKELGLCAFENCDSITEITIPKGLDTIGGSWGNGPFVGCDSLTTVKFEEGETSVERYLFAGCTGFKEIIIPDTIVTIEEGAFSECCNLVSVQLPEGLDTIKASAFEECTSLTGVALPTSLTTLEYCAFENCDSIEEITIPKSLNNVSDAIGKGPFYNCDNLKTVTFEEGITEITSYLFSGCTGITAIEIPETVTKVGISAFYECINLTDVEIPDSVEVIKENAFYDCSCLTDVVLPKNITTLGYQAFYDCDAIECIEIPKTLKNVSNALGDGPFSNCDNLKIVTFEEGITTVTACLFSGCTGITEIVIPETVTTIEGDAFYECTNLTKVVLPEKLEAIDAEAFLGCTSLTEIELPSTLTTLGYNAFEDCTSLTEITIPQSLKSVSDGLYNGPFGGCTSLTTVNFEEGITTIENYLFSGCTGLTTITIPNTVTSIEKEAFYKCKKLTSVTIPVSVTSIGKNAFSSCSSELVIYAMEGSYAIDYAIANNIAYSEVQIDVTEITLDTTEAELKQRETLQLVASFNPSFHTNVITWSSSDESVATVSKDGLVTAQDNVGTAVITVTASSGVSASCEITVKEAVCTVTYHLDGGTNNSDNPDVVRVTDDTIILKNPTREGYIFGGWYSDENFKIKVTQIKSGTKNDVVLYAKWTPITYSVKFNANGGTGKMSNISMKYDKKVALTNNTFKRKGYEFIGWNTAKDGTGTSYINMEEVASLTTTNKGTVILYAQWNAIDYSITYELNAAGDETVINPNEEITNYNITTATVTLAKPTRDNYTFAGWYSDAKFKKAVTKIAKGSTGNKTLYAKWTPNKYTIKFDKNDPAATGKMSNQKNLAFDKEYTLTKVGFSKKGYNFIGWATEETKNLENLADRVVYTNKDVVKGLTTENGVTVILYAVWEEAEYTITYNLNGGTEAVDGEGNPVNPDTYQMDSETIKLAAPTKPGYTFAYWCSDAKLKRKVSDTIKSGSTGNKTFYAKWTANKYTVKFVKNIEEGVTVTGSMKNQSMTYGKATALTSVGFKRAGYELAGWATDTTKDEATIEKQVKYTNKEKVSDLTTEKGGVVTLYAVWKVADYDIIYKNGGTHDNPTSYVLGSTETITLETPTKEGYDFEGWYSDAKFKKPIKDNKIDLTGKKANITVYAKWTAHKYTIKFDKNVEEDVVVTGTMKDMPNRSYGKSYTLTANTYKRAGYKFLGWSVSADGSTGLIKNKAKVSNLTKLVGKADETEDVVVTLYAQWEIIDYTITYKTGGEVNPNPSTYNVDMEEDINLQNPTREGYTFVGWYTDKNCKKKVSTPAIKAGSTGNKTFYAKWAANKYTITYDQNLGEGAMKVTGTMKDVKNVAYGKAVTLANNTYKRTGYKFLGWSTSADGSTGLIKNKAKVSNLTKQVGKANETENVVVTLYAQWDIIDYTITYKTNGGTNSESNPSTYTVESNITFEDPTMDGYEFVGWYSDAKGTKEVTAIEPGKTGNLTLYAVWKIVE